MKMVVCEMRLFRRQVTKGSNIKKAEKGKDVRQELKCPCKEEKRERSPKSKGKLRIWEIIRSRTKKREMQRKLGSAKKPREEDNSCRWHETWDQYEGVWTCFGQRPGAPPRCGQGKQATERARSSGTAFWKGNVCNLSGVRWIPGAEVEAASNTSYAWDEDDLKSDYCSLTPFF